MGLLRLSKAIICLVSVMLFACNASRGEGTERRSSSEHDTVWYEIRTLESTYGGCDPGDRNCTYFHVEYPVILKALSEAARDSVNSFIRRLISDNSLSEDAWLIELVHFMKRCVDRSDDDPDNPILRLPCYKHEVVSIVYNTPEVLSIEISGSSYTGGAHGSHWTVYANLDPKTSRQIELKNILVDGYQEALRVIAERKFREMYQIGREERLWDAGFHFEDDQFSLTDNFSISKQGLTFFYNEYEIAAYAKGPTKLTLTYEELSNLVRKDGPIGRR